MRASSAIRSCITSSSASIRPNSAARPSRSPSPMRCNFRASDLGLPVNEGARVYTLPCIAGHVGADSAGATLAGGPAPRRGDHAPRRCRHQRRDRARQQATRLVAASSPTGPAFEGAEISGGQRAAPGAIERVRIDPADARAARQGHRRRRMVRRPGLRARPRRLSASPASAAPASSRRSARCSWPASSATTA